MLFTCLAICSSHLTMLTCQMNSTGQAIGSVGEDLCLVMRIFRVVMSKFSWKLIQIWFLSHSQKQILLHLLRGLAHAHSRGVIHANLKFDNVFSSTDMTTEDINKWIISDPTRRHDHEELYDCIVSSTLSQPLPMINTKQALKATFPSLSGSDGWYRL